MFSFFAPSRREEPPAQQQDAPSADPHQPPLPYPDPPRSPRLQVEHARHLEEQLAILRHELADTRKTYEQKLADQREKLTAQLASQRDKYVSKTTRLEARNAWLEDTVQQLTAEKGWLAKRNEALERAEKALDARIGAFEEEVCELKADNAALRQENADYRADFDDVVGEVAELQKAAEAMAERAHKTLARPKAREQRSPMAGDEEARQRTPRGKRTEAPDADLSGETLTRTRERKEGEVRGRAAQAGGGVDPRSLEALRTLGASRNVSPSPTPDRGRQRRLGGGGLCAGGGSTATADAAPEDVAARPSRKRQRTESDTESGLTA
ncbi:hypothetical protein B0J12DRAFT_695496 [Macrophomina phaseolina]|uniref:Uncharacterized protein n=1 Tax=Macrophomina phaseolina TaxID=35725 RepID=A0ABQ8GNJ4_9PEZI|nr:hypothetical protein B0J12DRAFT_695496 [Macrophomina phaseolina]